MKASVITALTWAACTMAGPIGLTGRAHEECHCSDVETVTITVPAPTGGATSSPCIDTETATVTATAIETDSQTETNTNTDNWTNTATETNSNTVTVTNTVTAINTATNTATQTNTVTEPTVEPTNTNTATQTNTGTATGTTTAPPTANPTPVDCEDDDCHGTGHLVQDLGPQVNRLLTVTGEDGEDFLVQVNEDVYNLLSGRVSLSESIGEIVGDAATLGDLVADLGPIVDCILTIVGEDSRILLVRLAPEIADLLRGTVATLGLDSVNHPVGNIIRGLGLNLKRDGASNLFNVQGLNGQTQVLDLSGPAGDRLNENGIAGLVGSVIRVAIDVTQLLQDIGPDTENLLISIGRDGGAVLIRLAPGVANIVGTLLPELETPLGNIVYIVGDSL
ncbi:uncharacterized protein BDV17DRAFT_142748 [Aspergillus undulatus]|uniref:uncharacterized protein n=1 Tax=Aspergillus undulatus TaxID=1810928 RepID=UPI003CCE1A8A